MKVRHVLMIGLLFFPTMIMGEQITVSTIEGSPVSEIASLILTEIYKKAGLELEVISMPAVRATKESTSGKIDGETHRISTYETIHPELIKVPLSYYSIETVLFTRQDNPARNVNKENLSAYRVAILTGVRFSEELTSGFQNVKQFKNADLMMEFLKKGRTDFVVLSRLNGISTLKRLGLDGIVICNPPLETTLLYHYIHKSREYLVPILNETILQLKESGELEKIITNAEKQVMGL